MALTKKEVEDFILGTLLAPEKVAEIRELLDVPGSVVQRALRKWSATVQLSINPDGALPGELTTEERRLLRTLWRLRDGVLQHLKNGEIDEADSLSSKALAIAREHLDDTHPQLALALNNRGRVLHAQGDLSAALECQTRAAEVVAMLPPQRGTAMIFNDLAMTLMDADKYDEAERYHEQALALRKVLFGDIHAEVAQSLTNLGILYSSTDDYVSAERFLKRSIEMSLALDRTNDVHTATAWNNLGGVYQKLFDLEQANTCYQRALDIDIAVLGDQHPTVAVDWNNLGSLYTAQDRLSEALQCLQQSLTIKEGTLGPDHVSTANTLTNLASLYVAMKDFHQAELLYKKVLEIRRAALGTGHGDYATAINNLASVYRRSGDLGEAERLHREALAIRQQVYGPFSLATAQSWNNLGVILSDREAWDDAERCDRQSLEIKRTKLENDHPEVLLTLENLGYLSARRGNWGQAEAMYEEVLARRIERLGVGHSKCATTAGRLAFTYTAQGKTTEALQTLYIALRAEEHLITEIFSVADARQRMAVLTSRQHRLNHFLSLATTEFAHDDEALQFALEHVSRRKVLEAEPPLAQRDSELAVRYPANAQVLFERSALRRQLSIARLQVPRVMQETYRSRIMKWSEELAAIDRHLADNIPEERNWQQRVTANRWTIASRMPQRSALVECVRFSRLDVDQLKRQHRAVWAEDRYAAFVLSSQENERMSVIDLGEADSLDLAITKGDPHLAGTPAGLAATFESLLEDVAQCEHFYFAGDAALVNLSTAQVGLLVGLATESVEVLSCGADLMRAA